MLFTWSTHNLCILTSTWRITSPLSLFLSLLAIVIMTSGYEAVKEFARRWETTTSPTSGLSNSKSRGNGELSPFSTYSLPSFSIFRVYHIHLCYICKISISPLYIKRFIPTHHPCHGGTNQSFRTKLTSSSNSCWSCYSTPQRQADEDDKGAFLRRASILFVFHHVSPPSSPPNIIFKKKQNKMRKTLT